MKTRKQEERVSNQNSFPEEKEASDSQQVIRLLMNMRIPESNFINCLKNSKTLETEYLGQYCMEERASEKHLDMFFSYIIFRLFFLGFYKILNIAPCCTQ